MSSSAQASRKLDSGKILGHDSPLSPISSSVYGLTFRESKNLPYHRWYPYVEGFAAGYIEERILQQQHKVDKIYDPFGGAGTSMLTASCMGIESGYSEVNKFMQFVADTKVNCTINLLSSGKEISSIFDKYLSELRNQIAFEKRAKSACLSEYTNAFSDKDFFEIPQLRRLLAARDLANDMFCEEKDVLKQVHLAIASNVVKSSNMTRRADLRRRRPDEYKNRVIDVPLFITDKLVQIQIDLATGKERPHKPASLVTEDSRVLSSECGESFDMAITSPPYLNGTNYCRNTKLEQWFLGFLSHEKQLHHLRKNLVCAGINNVTRNRKVSHQFSAVDEVASLLDECAPDRRIPMLVRCYFGDMFDVFSTVYAYLKPGSRFYLDIGDSVFYGVHVKTDELLQEVAIEAGFAAVQKNTLAKRYSRDRTPLTQAELVLEKAF
jgi:DNA modification methylase